MTLIKAGRPGQNDADLRDEFLQNRGLTLVRQLLGATMPFEASDGRRYYFEEIPGSPSVWGLYTDER